MVGEETGQPGSLTLAQTEEKERKHSAVWTILWVIVHLLVGTAALGTTAGFLGQLWWGFEAVSHYRIQYFVVLAVGAVLLAAANFDKRAIVAGALSLVNLGLMVPFYVGAAEVDTQPAYRLVMANIEYVNEERDKVAEFLRSADADIIILEEFTPTWEQELEFLKTDYPHFVTEPRTDAWGIAFFSRIPTESIEVREIGAAGYPSTFTNYNLDGHPLTIIGTHPRHPIGDENVEARDEQMAAMVEIAAARTQATMMCGDFNTTLWSPNFLAFIADTDLENAAKGFGLQLTWPADYLVVGVPFDHCLASEEVRIHQFDTGPDVGADHLPIIVEFSVEEGQP